MQLDGALNCLARRRCNQRLEITPGLAGGARGQIGAGRLRVEVQRLACQLQLENRGSRVLVWKVNTDLRLLGQQGPVDSFGMVACRQKEYLLLRVAIPSSSCSNSSRRLRPLRTSLSRRAPPRQSHQGIECTVPARALSSKSVGCDLPPDLAEDNLALRSLDEAAMKANPDSLARTRAIWVLPVPGGCKQDVARHAHPELAHFLGVNHHAQTLEFREFIARNTSESHPTCSTDVGLLPAQLADLGHECVRAILPCRLPATTLSTSVRMSRRHASSLADHLVRELETQVRSAISCARISAPLRVRGTDFNGLGKARHDCVIDQIAAVGRADDKDLPS